MNAERWLVMYVTSLRGLISQWKVGESPQVFLSRFLVCVSGAASAMPCHRVLRLGHGI